MRRGPGPEGSPRSRAWGGRPQVIENEPLPLSFMLLVALVCVTTTASPYTFSAGLPYPAFASSGISASPCLEEHPSRGGGRSPRSLPAQPERECQRTELRPQRPAGFRATSPRAAGNPGGVHVRLDLRPQRPPAQPPVAVAV